MTNYAQQHVLQCICLIEIYIRVRLGSQMNNKKSIQFVDEVDEIIVIFPLFQFQLMIVL